MSIFGTKDVKTGSTSGISRTTTTPPKINVTAKADVKKEVKREIKDYSNKGNDFINENLSSIVELFDRANKNIIIHNLKVTGENDEEKDNLIEEIKNSIDEKFAKMNKRLDEMESANKASVSQKSEELEAKLVKTANENQDRIISTMESSMLATKTEVLKTIKESTREKSCIFGILITAVIIGAATAGLFLSDLL